MRKAWFQVCGLSEKVDDVSRVKICTLHFTPNDYTQPYAKLRGGRLVLKKTAVPVPGRLPSSPSVVRSSPMYVLQETKLFKVDISDDQEVPIVGLQLELDDAEDIENLRPW
ncbi:hypothetical protein FQA39_LY07014 [Lamprigera yunnana]|nr:hypothetical protein FQA39_LY07014 [Lamprigera yunnana]